MSLSHQLASLDVDLNYMKYWNDQSKIEMLKPQACLDLLGFHLTDTVLFKKTWHFKFLRLYLRFFFGLNQFITTYKENAFKYLLLSHGPALDSLCVKYLGEPLDYGVIALETIEADTYIGEYVGELCIVHLLSLWKDTTYMMHYPIPGLRGARLMVNALSYGNATRFINHSSNSNVMMKIAYDGKLFRLLVVTKEKIEKGEELRLDYGKKYWRRRQPPVI